MNEASARIVLERSYVELHMPEAVAVALLDVLRAVGGNPERTRRGLTAQVSQALSLAGVSPTPIHAKDWEGQVYFLECCTPQKQFPARKLRGVRITQGKHKRNQAKG